MCLLKASASVLLSLVLPEQSPSLLEDLSLLAHPECLWTVLAVNCCRRTVLDPEPSERLTPVSQYLRGIASSLFIQRKNGDAILEVLKDRLAKSSNDDLFDDEKLTKTRLYHQTITTCQEVVESINLNVEFLQRLSKGQLSKLSDVAHAYEAPGISFWRQSLAEEEQQLGELRLQVVSLSKLAQERVREPQFDPETTTNWQQREAVY